MNTRRAAPVIVTVSLVALLSGCAGAVASGPQVRDDLSPIAANAALGLARGHVIVKDDLSPNSNAARFTEQRSAATPKVEAAAWSAAVMRELKGSAPATVRDDLSPLRDGTRTPAPIPDTVDDDLSPLRGAN